MRILAVAVTFHPDTSLLLEALRSVAPQVAGLVIVDNGSANAAVISKIAISLGIQLIANNQNIGIAAAQNQGIRIAQKDGFSHVLLLDQDTLLAPGVVAELANSLNVFEEKQIEVAAIGPAYYEVNSHKRTKAYQAHGLHLSRISLDSATHPLATDFIIASGSLIPLQVLNHIGGFKENLFIDLVDTEWCLRARAAGYKCFLSPTARVDHRLGSGTLSIGRRQIAVHLPIRNYYWVRNALWLARQSYTPLAWRLYLASRCIFFLATYTTFGDNRFLRLRLMLQGIRDGLCGRSGPFQI